MASENYHISADGMRNSSQYALLTDIEAEAMDVLWDSNEPLTANQIVSRIFERRKSAGGDLPNYTTLVSMLGRLSNKGILETNRVSPRTIVYSSRIARSQFAAHAMNNIFSRILKKDLRQILPNLGYAAAPKAEGAGQDARIDDPELQQLLESIERLSEA